MRHDLEPLRAALGSLRALLESATGEAVAGDGMARCPFHEEKTPSLHLFDADRRWKCFGCGAGGDVFDFEARRRGLVLGDLLRELRTQGDRSPVRSVVRPARASRKEVAPARPRRDVVGVWTRALAGGRAALAGDSALDYLSRRLSAPGDPEGRGRDPARQLLADGEAGIASADERDAWVRERAHEGYRLAIPLWTCPPPGVVARPTAPHDLALRHVGPGDPPNGRKILRLPGCGGVVPFYGYPPGAVAAADAGTLYVVEGAFDFLTLRAARLAAVGVFAADYARRSGPPLRGEIEAVRAAGVGGPVRVVCVDQNDTSSRAGMDAVAEELARVEGLHVERTSPVLEGRNAA